MSFEIDLSDKSQKIKEKKFREVPISAFARHWNDRWPADLPKPAVLIGTEDDPSARLVFTRNDLFELGKDLDSDSDLLNFYVAVCSWGAGNKAQSIARVVKPLHQPDALERIRAALKVTSAEGATEGYRAFNNTSRSKVKFLGAAFFTKLMHFSQGVPVEGVDVPLILDKRVAEALGWQKVTGWKTAEYADYLEQASKLRQEWMPDEPLDAIEFQLFLNGKK